MSKRIDESDSFHVAIECAPLDRVNNCKEFWINEGFKDQRPKKSQSYTVKSKEQFVFFVKNLKMSGDSEDIKFQFHPRRRNFQCFTVETSQQVKKVSGQVQVTKILPITDDDQNSEAKRKTKSITNILITLSKEAEKEEEEEEEQESEIVIPPVVEPPNPPVAEAPNHSIAEAPKPPVVEAPKPAKPPATKPITPSRNLLASEGPSEPTSRTSIAVMKEKSFDFTLSEKGEPSFKGFVIISFRSVQVFL
jgi:hypothetical protein